jgi:pyruvate dehydrogenase (quinone)
MSQTVAEVIVETLQAAGVKHCWGVPGDTLNYVTDAIRRSGIKWVHVRHEEAGGFAAGAEALLTGELTACAGSCGPGSLHFINGLFESHRNRAPVVLIASQITSKERDFDFPQEVDFEQFYPDKARIVQVDIDPTHLGRRHPVELGVVGDIKATVAALLPKVKARSERGFLDDCVARHDKALATLEKRAVAHEGRIHPQYLAHLIDKHAAEDAIFTADGGSPTVWLLRHVKANGKRRTLISLTHGTMANAMPQALGAKRAFPDRQVISMSGDGGLAMMLGDLLTAIQEKIPLKIVVFNNGALGFVELEMKVEGLLNAYTDLVNPDFSRVAEAIGFHARRVEKAADLDSAVKDWLAQPGPALLDVVTSRMELVMPPFVGAEQAFGTALYSAKAMLGGRAGDVWDLVTENL